MTVKLFHGDCLEVLKTIPSNSIHAVVTDPPYGISFMNSKWDYDVPSIEIWIEVLRVLKSGGHLLSFSSPRTYHRMAVAIEDAGFEIRDQLCWINSQGMPHGMDISKAIDKAAGMTRKVVGTKINTYDGSVRDPSKHGNPAAQSNIGKWGLTRTPHGMPLTEAATDMAKQWEGWNTTLKPAIEPIVLARKPLDGNIVENILKHDVGGINIDECRIPVDMDRVGSSPIGRYPSGLIWDGSDEVKQVFDSFGEKTSGVPGPRRKAHKTHSMSGTLGMMDKEEVGYADSGSVARFYKSCEYSEEERRIFYCGKVSAKERQGSKHPTLKPLALMSYLCKLITPKDGMVLDPFAGSGTTGEAAALNGFNAILIEREEEYIKDCRNRLAFFLED